MKLVRIFKNPPIICLEVLINARGFVGRMFSMSVVVLRVCQYTAMPPKNPDSASTCYYNRIMKQEQDHDESEPLPQTNGNNDDALGSSLSCSSEDDDQASSDPKAQRKKNYRPGGVAGEKTIVVKVKPNTATIFPPTPQQQTITRVLRRPRLASAASPRNRKLADEFSDSPSGGTDGGGAPAKKRVRRETLPDIAERIPVDALRPYLKMSLVSAAKVRSNTWSYFLRTNVGKQQATSYMYIGFFVVVVANCATQVPIIFIEKSRVSDPPSWL